MELQINKPLPPLLSGEKILWQGQSNSGFIFRPIELFLVPFSLLWGGFALFWNISAWTADSPLFFNLFGLPFLIIGVYLIFGRFLIDAWIRKKTHYFVTNQRVLITRGFGSKVKSLDLKRLPGLELEERPDGSGTIRFGGSTNWFMSANFGIWQPTFDEVPQFIRIPNVRIVYELIQNQFLQN